MLSVIRDPLLELERGEISVLPLPEGTELGCRDGLVRAPLDP